MPKQKNFERILRRKYRRLYKLFTSLTILAIIVWVSGVEVYIGTYTSLSIEVNPSYYTLRIIIHNITFSDRVPVKLNPGSPIEFRLVIDSYNHTMATLKYFPSKTYIIYKEEHLTLNTTEDIPISRLRLWDNYTKISTPPLYVYPMKMPSTYILQYYSYLYPEFYIEVTVLKNKPIITVNNSGSDVVSITLLIRSLNGSYKKYLGIIKPHTSIKESLDYNGVYTVDYVGNVYKHLGLISYSLRDNNLYFNTRTNIPFFTLIATILTGISIYYYTKYKRSIKKSRRRR